MAAFGDKRALQKHAANINDLIDIAHDSDPEQAILLLGTALSITNNLNHRLSDTIAELEKSKRAKTDMRSTDAPTH
jgi:hypothetical protein